MQVSLPLFVSGSDSFPLSLSRRFGSHCHYAHLDENGQDCKPRQRIVEQRRESIRLAYYRTSFETFLERLFADDTASSGDDESVDHRQDLDGEESDGHEGRSYDNEFDSTYEDMDDGSSYHPDYSSANEDVDQQQDDEEVEEAVDPSFSHSHGQPESSYDYNEGCEQWSFACDSQGADEEYTGWEYEHSPRSSQYEDATGWGDEGGGSDYEDYCGGYGDY